MKLGLIGEQLSFKDVPFLKRAASKYMVSYNVNKKKSVEEHRKTKMEAFGAKGKGLTDLHRHLRKEPATPLVAVRRKK